MTAQIAVFTTGVYLLHKEYMTRNWRGHRILQYIVQEPSWGPNIHVRWDMASKTSDWCCPGTLLMDTRCGLSFQKLDTWILENN